MTDADVEQALRTVRPVKVVALLEDDREVPIAIPRGTRKWERMATTIASQPWAEIRLLDKVGGLMAAPLLREQRAPSPAAEDISAGSAADVMVPAGVVSTLLRATISDVARGFVEVVKATRTSGSAEVTAALTANRETIIALHGVIDDIRGELNDTRAKVSDLEGELAKRLADEVTAARIESKPTTGERFFDRLLDGAAAGAADAAGAAGAGKGNGA